jgi:hypothetical protein
MQFGTCDRRSSYKASAMTLFCEAARKLSGIIEFVVVALPNRGAVFGKSSRRVLYKI